MYKLLKLALKVEDMANKASSDYLMTLCESAYFHLFNEYVLVYATIKDDTNTDILSQYPVQEFNFDIPELKDINEFEENNIKIKNGEMKPYFMV